MDKEIFEALPHLKVPDEMRERLAGSIVTRVAMSHDRREVKVYIDFFKLITRKEINNLSAHIKNQFFNAQEVVIRIFPSYKLEGIPLTKIYELYKDSICEELKEDSAPYFQFTKEPALSFSENDVTVRIDGTDLWDLNDNQKKSLGDYYKDYFTEVFNGRFGFSVNVTVDISAGVVPPELTHTEEEDTPEFSDYAASDDGMAYGGGFDDGFVSSDNGDFVTLSDLGISNEKFDEIQNHTTKSQKKGSSSYPKSNFIYNKKGRKRIPEEEGYGHVFEGAPIRICDINEPMGGVVVKGYIIYDPKNDKDKPRKTANGKTIYSATITDMTDSIRFKIFATDEETKPIEKLLKKEPYVTIGADAEYDKFEKEVTLQRIKGIRYEVEKCEEKRTDSAEKKRVELHCHTKMSEMDGVSDVEDIVKKAADFGHKAIAITDHGVVYAFPNAMKAAKGCAKKGKPIKVIYGCEGYLVDDAPGDSVEDIMKKKMYHIILLCKSDVGRINLYRIVSESHLKYYHKRPRIPRSLIEECREGLIIGSACEAGELYRAIVDGEPEEKIEEIASFYDYLEIQPIGNNLFMIRDKKFPDINSVGDLEDINAKIVELGDKLGKPVCATCDVHFLTPEDEIYRRILMAGMGYEDADNQPPLFLRTTEEMLDEFMYLGKDKAYEIVVENTNRIADMCEEISPVRPDKCPPTIEGSEDNLRKICYDKAHEMYGDPLPAIVQDRLDKEINSIIGNGYSVMYVFAQMLVKKSNDDGYLVGSRGSVGSSFAATMADITEVNPLPPHYLCPECKYSDFDSDDVKAYIGKTGYDMPDKVCPKCGAKLRKEGIDIPFETFLGFKGDKEPDIDLNFSGEYQSKAHAYTAELFGDGYTFRAGTISGLADKTAYGYVKNYFEERGIVKRNCEIDRLIVGCQGVRKSTGQHPGGIVVMPKGENIYSFTPIQHPANDMKTDTITTHFDYHKIEQNLLKFDILGHDDPTMMKWLSDMTGVDPKSIPMDDPKTYSLFEGLDVLGLKPEQLGGTKFGTYGIPEFNTDFAMGMLADAKPKNFADLVNVAGLAHGTDVWLGNAKDLILSGKATLQTAICTRDEIMNFLIGKGIEPSLSFTIMEAVRKGKVAGGDVDKWGEWKEEMKAHDIPDWYIESCEKIKYMFPKAHAAAYVMMAIRVAYFKIYYPLAFYSAYFGIRAKGFDYEKMCMGKENMEDYLAYYRQNKDKLAKKENDTYQDLRVCEEMYARGFEFTPIDIYQADDVKFKIVDGKIMPALNTISGMGEKAAAMLCEEAKKGKFLSREDLISRAKLSKTLVEYMDDLGLLGNMPKSNQLSLFDIELE